MEGKENRNTLQHEMRREIVKGYGVQYIYLGSIRLTLYLKLKYYDYFFTEMPKMHKFLSSLNKLYSLHAI